MYRKYILMAAGMMVLAGLSFYAVKEYQEQQAAAHVLSGTIEVTKVDVTPKTSGYIEDVYIREGDKIKKGTLAVRLSRKELEAAYLRDQASYAAAKANLKKLQTGNRMEEIQAAAGRTRAAEAAMNKAEKDFARMEQLMAVEAISKQAYDAAKANREVALANWKSAKEEENLLEHGTREEDLAMAQYTVEEREAVLAISGEAIKDLSLYAPCDGVVLSKNYEAGEYVNAGAAIATLADLSDCWVKVYVSPENLGKIKLGQSAKVQVDSKPGEFIMGKVIEIKDSAEYTPRQSITKNERANMVFAVKVKLPNEEGSLKPGMPADVMFDEI